METLRALVRGDLSPAGNKISLNRAGAFSEYVIDGYSSIWVDSGTSALALAFLDAKAKASRVKTPKVIIPGYCCPDLVAAAVYAGVKPLVVDINIDDAAYDLDALQTAIDDENVIAIIAVNFLGIKEQLLEIKSLLQNKSIKLIEDNAQWFPGSNKEHLFRGDYLLFSFGRGKPLSLLGGGALFSREALVVGDVISTQANPASLTQKLKIHLYNFLLNPRLYCYLNRAPFLHLGETHYHPHSDVSAMGELQRDIFSANLESYQKRITSAEGSYDELFFATGAQSLAAIRSPRRMRLLRYPLLCKTPQQREKLLKKLIEQGLGASPLYQRALIEIPNILELVEVHGVLKNSAQFAARLLTLPTHEQVVAKHFARLSNYLNWAQS